MTRYWRISALLWGLILVIGPLSAAAADHTGAPRTSEERAQVEADLLRERAAALAQSQLGLPPLYPGFGEAGQPFAPDRYLDFWALSAQMARLAAALSATAGCMTGAFPCQSPAYTPAPAGPQSLAGTVAGMQQPLAPVYGPAGPTTASVRALLAYRLVVAGNPRLGVGEVTEDDDRVIADVVTTDGSLVERYSVDKRTGAWRAER